MANPDQVAMLKRSVSEWNKWREVNPNIKPDLSDADLSDADLSDADLSDANLNKSNLSDANLSNANLSNTSLFNVNLTNSYLSDADFRNARLRYADLRYADLRYADLSDADLSDADLSDVDLSRANLSRANLSRANLNYAKLGHAHLSYAKLTDSDLSHADLSHAILENVFFTVALCDDTIFTNVDLSQAIGLETVEHQGRSYIDIHTLYNSQGNIPEVFLRGCGVPEDFITYLPSFINKPIQFYSCFISYNHKDKAFARRVHDTLQGRGIRCWLDEKEINPGEKIMDAVAHGIRYWDKVILCASQHSLNSWWVDNEIDSIFAKERDIQAEKGKIIPLLIPCDLDGHLFSLDYQGGKKEQIKSRLAAKFEGWEHDNALFEAQIERIIKALRTDGGKQPPPKSHL